MPPVGADRQALDPFRAVNSSIGPFIRHFWMQSRVTQYSLLDLWLGLSRKRISHDREALRGSGRHLRECRRMEGFRIAATQRQRADVLRIHRLPPDRYLRFLRIILAVLRRDRREQSGR